MDRLARSFSAQPVLYVEDNPVNAMLMSAMFELRPDLSLVLAYTVADALERARVLHPALLLLDLRLPDGDGRDLLSMLRRLPGCENAPAVAVTAEDDFELRGSGFTEMWTKPLDLHRVLRRLDALASCTPNPPRLALENRFDLPADRLQARLQDRFQDRACNRLYDPIPARAHQRPGAVHPRG